MPSCDLISITDDPNFDGTDVVEIPLLLPVWQMSALERAAHRRGMTAAEMVRQLLREYVTNSTTLR